MSFYGQREYGQNNNYRSNTARRNSNSFSEEETGPKRKRWNKRGGGNNGGGPRNNDTVSPQPLFKEPAPAPRRSPAQNRNRDFSQNGPSSSRPYFDMRDMPKFVEPEHSGRPWGWDNYSQSCKTWQDKHKLAYYKSRCLALEFENQMLFDQVSSLMEENCIFSAMKELCHQPSVPFVYKLIPSCRDSRRILKAEWREKTDVSSSSGLENCESVCGENNSEYTEKMPCPVGLDRRRQRERGVMPSMRLPEFPGLSELSAEGESRSSNKRSTQNKDQGKDKATSEISSDIDFEVSEDMMDLIEKSIRHKLTLKRQRKEEGDKKRKTDGISKEKEAKDEEGPKRPAGLKRKEELELLYGGTSSLIHKLETAAQLNFNRNCDTLKPELWMAAPLNPETLVE